MRASPRLLSAALPGLVVLALAAPACGGRSARPADDVTVAADLDMAPGEDRITTVDMDERCRGLEQDTCSRTTGCRRVACPGCNGEPGPFQCAPVGQDVTCPDVTCIECREIASEAACLTIPGCLPRRCPACPDGSPERFIDCVRDDQTAPPACVCALECDGYTDEASCESAGCAFMDCPRDCDGQNNFDRCYDPAAMPPPLCPKIDCPFCQGRSEADCWAAAQGPGVSCRADYCQACGGNDVFTRCSLQGEPATACPALGCPTPVCDGLDEAACQSAAMCHPVHDSDGDYARCAPGTADCQSTPYCLAPVGPCPEGFRHLVRSGCYEGCAPVPAECPAP